MKRLLYKAGDCISDYVSDYEPAFPTSEMRETSRKSSLPHVINVVSKALVISVPNFRNAGALQKIDHVGNFYLAERRN